MEFSQAPSISLWWSQNVLQVDSKLVTRSLQGILTGQKVLQGLSFIIAIYVINVINNGIFAIHNSH